MLARGLAQIPGIAVNQPETNLIFFDPAATGIGTTQMIAELRARGILTGALDHRIRACTHLDVSAAMIEETISAIRDITSKA